MNSCKCRTGCIGAQTAATQLGPVADVAARARRRVEARHGCWLPSRVASTPSSTKWPNKSLFETSEVGRCQDLPLKLTTICILNEFDEAVERTWLRELIGDLVGQTV